MEIKVFNAPVPYDVYITFYKKIPRDKKDFFKDFMGVSFVNRAFTKDYISRQRFERMLEFINIIESTAFSRIIDRSVIDNEQKRLYFDRLCSYISTDIFKNLTLHKQAKIHYEISKVGNELLHVNEFLG